MKPRYVIVVLLVLALAVPPLMLAQGSKDEQQIRAIEKEMVEEAYLKGGAEGAAVLDKIYADDYTGVRGDGRVLTKAQELEAFKSGVIKYQASETKESKIRVFGNSAVSTSLTFNTNMRNGKTYSGKSRNVRVWTKQQGNWKCIYFQTTRVLD
jgi:hypothetical protein